MSAEAQGGPLIDPADPQRPELFPKLREAQLARLRPLGQVRSFRAGEAIWEQGQRNVSFFVILEGTIEVVTRTAMGVRLVAVEGAGEFGGEADLLSGRPAMGSARARIDSRLLEIPHEAFRSLLTTDAEIGELVLRALLLRRTNLLTHAQGDVVLVGSSHSAQMLELQEFLTRNGRPHVTLDVERDERTQGLLDTWHIGVDETPGGHLPGHQRAAQTERRATGRLPRPARRSPHRSRARSRHRRRWTGRAVGGGVRGLRRVGRAGA